jgi:hypothetical protein
VILSHHTPQLCIDEGCAAWSLSAGSNSFLAAIVDLFCSAVGSARLLS